MTQLRYLIADADELWAMKDQLKRQELISEDPITLHKRRFNQWLKAAAQAALETAAEQGVDEDEAIEVITARLATIQQTWRAEAKRRHQ